MVGVVTPFGVEEGAGVVVLCDGVVALVVSFDGVEVDGVEDAGAVEVVSFEAILSLSLLQAPRAEAASAKAARDGRSFMKCAPLVRTGGNARVQALVRDQRSSLTSVPGNRRKLCRKW